jgi:hypothetical protein
VVIAVLVGLAIQIVFLYLISSWFSTVPPNFRTMEPWQVWLLLIPCFNIIWNFFVYQRIPQSFQNYFNSQGRYDQGDCGTQVGLWYAICVICSAVPIVNYVAGPAALVLWIIFLVKLYQLKQLVLAGAAAGYLGGTGSPPPFGGPGGPFGGPGGSGSSPFGG